MRRLFEGAWDARGLRVALVVSRCNEILTDRLLQGALDCLRRHGAADDDLSVVRVPGGFELPLLAKTLAPFRGWPIQSDHLAIRHRALVRWTQPELRLNRRSWVGWYLALEYERLPSPLTGTAGRADKLLDSRMAGRA